MTLLINDPVVTDNKSRRKCKQSSRGMQAFQTRNASIPDTQQKHSILHNKNAKIALKTIGK